MQARANRSIQSSKEVEAQTIFDLERDHYQLVYVGWKRHDIRDYGCLLHLDIKDGKIWIQYDGTEGGIAYELVNLGVPREDIVLGFQPVSVRPHTEFAVS
jgi:hypothetical protein